MDVSSLHGMSVSEDVIGLYDLTPLSVDQPQSTCGVTRDVSVNDLEHSLTDCLQIQDDKEFGSSSIPPSDMNDIGNGEKEDNCEEPHQCKSTTSEKCLCKSATFPRYGKMTSFSVSIDGEAEDEEGKDGITAAVLAQSGYAKSVDPLCSRAISLPTSLKLVSAMKGSREKQGTPPKRLTVTWAPDVYDPTPTAVSHVATNKNQRHRSDSKKSGKNKQKGGGGGKPSRGSRGKDKKQVRKYGGSSNKCFKSLDDEEKLVDHDEPHVGLVDLNVGSPDSYCGSSFLKKSVTRFHFSVAEAT